MTSTMVEQPGEAVVPSRPLFRAWLISVTLGEFVGFCIPALAGALVRNSPAAVVVPTLVAAGAVEGTVLGWSQVRVLCGPLPALRGRLWVAGTAGAASLAWLIGMLPSTFSGSWSRWPAAVVIALGAVLGTTVLCSIGVAQWLQLRRLVPRAGRWIAATAAAWCAGLAVFTGFTTPLWQPGQPGLLSAGIGGLGGLLMAAAMAAVTGWALGRILGHRRQPDRS